MLFSSHTWSGIGASFGPAIVLLIFWKRFSQAGVFASLITGTLSADIWKTWLAEPTGISERIASYLLAFSMAGVFKSLPKSLQGIGLKKTDRNLIIE